jgi:hypothetical protein
MTMKDAGSDGESDGKIGVARKELNVFQVIASAGDN